MSALLTSSGRHALEDLLTEYGPYDGPFMQALRHKLRTARTLNRVPGDVATIGSRLRFTVNGIEDERTLVLPRDYLPDGRCLALNTLRGLSLLGVRAGDTVTLPQGPPLRLIDVPYQPEARAHRAQTPVRIMLIAANDR